MKKLKIDYRHFILSFIILCTIIVSFVYFTNAYGRVVESIRDFGLSCAYYFCEMFSIEHNITPTINNLPKYPLFSWFSKYAVVPDLTKINIPETWELFKTNWSIYWQKIIQKENVINYLKYADRKSVV